MSALSICQQNSYERRSVNKVLECVPASHQQGKYIVTLDDCVLYPEGGGQPSDSGTVGGLVVEKLEKSPHSSTSVAVHLSAPLEPGSQVECVVDWMHRYDHMQQHSSQHLLSAIASKELHAETVGWSLGVDSVSVDLQKAEGFLSPAEIQHLEKRVNDVIRTAIPLTAKSYPMETILAGTDDELVNLRGAPKGAALGLDTLRMVGIEGWDLNPCGGTHLRSVAEIQCLKIIGWEKDRGAIRIRYLAGNRAIDYFGTCLQREAALSAILSVPPSEHVSSVERFMSERKSTEKDMKALTSEFASLLGASLAKGLANSPVLVHHRHGANLNFLLWLADAIVAAGNSPSALIFLSGDDLPLSANAASPPAPAATGGGKKKGKEKESKFAEESSSLPPPPVAVAGAAPSLPFVLIGPPAAIDSVKAQVFALVKGKGGGRPGRLQGVASDVSMETLEQIRSLLMTIPR